MSFLAGQVERGTWDYKLTSIKLFLEVRLRHRPKWPAVRIMEQTNKQTNKYLLLLEF